MQTTKFNAVTLKLEAYSEPTETNNVDLFAKNSSKTVHYFPSKRFILKIWLVLNTSLETTYDHRIFYKKKLRFI